MSAALSQGAAVAVTEGPKTIFEGVYTTDQASRGKSLFSNNCASCHGAKAGGGPAGPALTGSSLDIKEGLAASDIVDFMIMAMPPESPGKLRTREYVDIFAFLLELHGAPAGETELSGKLQDLQDIEIVVTPEAGAEAQPEAAPAPAAESKAAPQPTNDGH